jgi:hypothetical protein
LTPDNSEIFLQNQNTPIIFGCRLMGGGSGQPFSGGKVACSPSADQGIKPEIFLGFGGNPVPGISVFSFFFFPTY